MTTQRKPLAGEETKKEDHSDIMCLEDLDESCDKNMTKKPQKLKKTKGELSFECGFNVDDSSSNEELAALPSIQNEYTLQIKSIYQYKKPYISQLQTNYFESDFYTILGEMDPE